MPGRLTPLVVVKPLDSCITCPDNCDASVYIHISGLPTVLNGEPGVIQDHNAGRGVDMRDCHACGETIAEISTRSSFRGRQAISSRPRWW